MSIDFSCGCGTPLRVKDEYAGRRVRCPQCGAVVIAQKSFASDDSLSCLGDVDDAAKQSPLDRVLTRNTTASIPGKLRLHLPTYVRSYPLWPTVLLVAFFVFLVSAAASPNNKAWIFLGAFSLGIAGYVRVISMYMRLGDVNPGIVVSTEPYLVAVLADLDATRSQPYWVVKILRQPLQRMVGGPPPLGARLSTVATYEGNAKKSGRWGNVRPCVANCVTNDEQAVRQQFARIPKEMWTNLDAALRQVSKPYRPGIYPVSLA